MCTLVHRWSLATPVEQVVPLPSKRDATIDERMKVWWITTRVGISKDLSYLGGREYCQVAGHEAAMTEGWYSGTMREPSEEEEYPSGFVSAHNAGSLRDPSPFLKCLPVFIHAAPPLQPGSCLPGQMVVELKDKDGVSQQWKVMG